MKFVFFDKSKVEMEIITDVLSEEKIPYKIKKYVVKDFFFSEDDDDDDDDICIIEEMYNIEVHTDLEHFDFVKAIAYKKIENRIHLERSYLMKDEEKRNVQRVHKKNITNTNSNDRK